MRELKAILDESQHDIDAGRTIPMELVNAEVYEMLEQAKLDAERGVLATRPCRYQGNRPLYDS
ncbi:MAG: hypothetical protein COW29_10750 [Rhodobacterales bacterium CG15_BIG_FIL_POST_REV_8_21_14_020_59_13]|nr:MAG: hypothetical protein COW29_10750 [Rhodobacterales bacterium CG15_BIG_FIL_POST_REV_8_21_14_020_59_13]